MGDPVVRTSWQEPLCEGSAGGGFRHRLAWCVVAPRTSYSQSGKPAGTKPGLIFGRRAACGRRNSGKANMGNDPERNSTNAILTRRKNF